MPRLERCYKGRSNRSTKPGWYAIHFTEKNRAVEQLFAHLWKQRFPGGRDGYQ
jgi:hypothetical protein